MCRAIKLAPIPVDRASCLTLKAPEGRHVYSTLINQFSQAPEGRHVCHKIWLFLIGVVQVERSETPIYRGCLATCVTLGGPH